MAIHMELKKLSLDRSSNVAEPSEEPSAFFMPIDRKITNLL
ncbi:hypothetical protein PAAL109150_07335 [Paenibacillus alkaliterrae]